MDSKQMRIVTMVAMIVGITIYALIMYFGPIAALPSGGAGFIVVIMALAALRYKKPPATTP
jgi:hypothetical protein